MTIKPRGEGNAQEARPKLLEDEPADPVDIEVQSGFAMSPAIYDENPLQLDDSPNLQIRRQVA